MTSTDTPTARTYRVEYRLNPGEASESFINAERYVRECSGRLSWVTFVRDGRVVAEIAESAITLIEEYHPELDDDEQEPDAIHGWFGLSYANYQVLHRSLMQSMPDEWQNRAVRLFEELREAFPDIEHPQYNVEAGRWVEPTDLTGEQMKALGVTRTDTDEDDETGVWHDRFGNELDPHQTCVFVPGSDPIPHYNRGRTRVARAE